MGVGNCSRLISLLVLVSFLFIQSCGNKSSNNDYVTQIDPLPSNLVQLTVSNNKGKSGYYYLPTGYNTESVPLMILFHGTNYHGIDMINEFKSLAESNKFILLAPDSSRKNKSYPEWDSTSLVNDNEDFKHTEDSLNELLAISNVKIDYLKVMAGGFSAGSWFAAYYSSNTSFCTHYVSLHGGVTIETIGSNKPVSLFTCGTLDNICSCPLADYNMNTLTNMGFIASISKYSNGHYLIESEKIDVVKWWLNG